MAFVYSGSVCQICSKELGNNYDDKNVIGLPEGILTFTDFNSFNDNVIHQSCFQIWAEAEEFVALMNSDLKRSGRKEYLITKERKLEHVL